MSCHVTHIVYLCVYVLLGSIVPVGLPPNSLRQCYILTLSAEYWKCQCLCLLFWPGHLESLCDLTNEWYCAAVSKQCRRHDNPERVGAY
jgi:hypothetical protein